MHSLMFTIDIPIEDPSPHSWQSHRGLSAADIFLCQGFATHVSSQFCGGGRTIFQLHILIS